ncbi:MAG: hypothetical protein GY940_25485, partial [bacterium]|nr:hypothetical protein [bacterium]
GGKEYTDKFKSLLGFDHTPDTWVWVCCFKTLELSFPKFKLYYQGKWKGNLEYLPQPDGTIKPTYILPNGKKLNEAQLIFDYMIPWRDEHYEELEIGYDDSTDFGELYVKGSDRSYSTYGYECDITFFDHTVLSINTEDGTKITVKQRGPLFHRIETDEHGNQTAFMKPGVYDFTFGEHCE